jgi:hypothetical protein
MELKGRPSVGGNAQSGSLTVDPGLPIAVNYGLLMESCEGNFLFAIDFPEGIECLPHRRRDRASQESLMHRNCRHEFP